eukprot:3382013-Amphidinium_carterae.1
MVSTNLQDLKRGVVVSNIAIHSPPMPGKTTSKRKSEYTRTPTYDVFTRLQWWLARLGVTIM